MSAQKEFEREVDTHLQRLNDDIEDVLRQLIEQDYPEAVKGLAFEVFPDSFTSEFPVKVFFMDKYNAQYFVFDQGKPEVPSDVPPELLDIDEVYPYELEDEYELKADDFDPWDVATHALIQWFSTRWQAAGGDKFALNACITPTDTMDDFNLKTGHWDRKPESLIEEAC